MPGDRLDGSAAGDGELDAIATLELPLRADIMPAVDAAKLNAGFGLAFLGIGLVDIGLVDAERNCWPKPLSGEPLVYPPA